MRHHAVHYHLCRDPALRFCMVILSLRKFIKMQQRERVIEIWKALNRLVRYLE
jgi:hypothetical protein